MDVNPLANWNALGEMVRTDDGMVTDVSPVARSNADIPMFVAVGRMIYDASVLPIGY